MPYRRRVPPACAHRERRVSVGTLRFWRPRLGLRAQVSAGVHLTCYRRHQRSGMAAVTFLDRNSPDQSSLHRTDNPRYTDETFRPGWVAGSSPMGPRCDRSERTTFAGALPWSVTCSREKSESTVCSHPGLPGFMGATYALISSVASFPTMCLMDLSPPGW